MLKTRQYAELTGATLASMVSYMLTSYAQPSMGKLVDTETVSQTTMRTALAAILFLTALLTLMLARCMFKELPIERRREFYTLKR